MQFQLKEQIPKNKAQWILNNFDNLDVNDNRKDKDFETTKKMIKNYLYDVLDAKEGILKKTYKSRREGKGRLYVDGYGLQSMMREYRHTLCNEEYYDIDIVNAHNVFMVQYCFKNNIKCSNLEKYVRSRDKYFLYFAEKYEMNKTETKNFIISLLYGKKLPEKFEEDKKIKNLYEELQTIHNKISILNPDILEYVKAKKDININGSVASHLMQEIENNILMVAYDFFKKEKFEIGALCFDGLMIRKNKNLENNKLKELSFIVKSKLDYEVEFIIKPMEDGFEIPLDELQNIEICNPNLLRKQEETNIIIKKCDEEYLELKKKIESEYFYISEMGKFGYYNEIEDKLTIISESTLKLNLAPYKIKKYEYSGKYKKMMELSTDFYSRWIQDSTRRSYKNICFDPNEQPINYFNLFNGFYYEKYEPKGKANLENINFVLDHVLGEHKKYIFEWLAFILKKKKKTNVAIILYTDNHGVGKNSIVELIMRLFTNSYSTKIESIDDLCSNFNGSLERKFFCYGDEILAKNKDLYTTFKNTITRTEIKINKKGIDEYTVVDLCNYMFTTNDSTPFKIESNDRRTSLIHCNEKKLGNDIYNKFYEDLNNKDNIKMMFDYLMTLTIPDKIECLETELKKNIQEAFLSGPIKYLYKNYNTLENVKLSTMELYDKIKDFEKHQGYTETKNTKFMSLQIQKIADFNFRTNEKRGYHFKNLKENLIKYNKDLFDDYNNNKLEDMEEEE